MASNNKNYWQKRFAALEDEQYQRTLEYFKDLKKQFDLACLNIGDAIRRWYDKLAENNNVTLAGAKKLLAENELKEFKWTVEQYIKAGKKNNITDGWVKKLKNASARFHISYLEAMKIQIQQQLEVLAAQYNSGLSNFLEKSYENTYYHTAYEIAKGLGVGHDLTRLDSEKIEIVIKKPWARDGSSFSNRIWLNKEKLVNTLHTELAQNIIRGSPPRKAIEQLSKAMEVNRAQAGRLVMTESAAISSLAQKGCFKELNVKKYEILATLDTRTSEICQEMDGRVFDMVDYEISVTAPPFHPHCRTTAIPYFKDEFRGKEMRAARGADNKNYHVSSDMKYEEWKKKYVDASFPKMEISQDLPYGEYSHKEILALAKIMEQIVEKHIQIKSKWSGRIVGFSDKGYGKLWNCDIATSNKTAPHIILHEQLHAVSISYFDVDTYLEYQNIEEAAVQFMAQEISKAENIEVIESEYDSMTDVLRSLNKLLKYGTDYDFAKKLIKIPVPERLQWLEGFVSDIMMKTGTIEQYQEIAGMLDLLR